jgi:hypothetical protein
MFQFPKQTEFNRSLPKSKIYAFARPTRSMKDRFVAGIQDIVWKYKLAPETVNLPARHGVQEIQVFAVTLKTKELADEVLHTIDKSIPSPIVFQITFGDRIRFSAAYKRPSEADASKNVIAAYFTTDWQPVAQTLPVLPVVLDMAALYDEMLRRVLPLPCRDGESLAAHVERAVHLRAKQRECRDLEARLRRERQFNRKVEINAAIRAAKTQIKQLTAC